MKKITLITISLFALIIMLTCERFELIKITKVDTELVEPSYTSATVYGNIIELSSESHSEYGFCYGVNSNPTVADEKKVIGTAQVGEFKGVIEGLTMGKEYNICAYCKEGDAYI